MVAVVRLTCLLQPATVPESGASAPKGGKKVTVIHGINFAGEALPPYIQFPTDATNVDNYKLKKQLLPTLPQVKARYGYSKVRSFDVGFGMNPKGKSSPAVVHYAKRESRIVL